MMTHYLTTRQISLHRTMDLSFTPDQDALREAAQRLYAKVSHGEAVRGREVEGFDPELWDGVVAMGLPTMAVDEAAGGADASLTDLAAAVEVHGAHLGLVPLVETAVVARLLARLARVDGDGSPADEALDQGADGARGRDATAAALARVVDGAPATLRIRSVDGAPTAFAAVADVIVAYDGEALVLFDGSAGPARGTLAGLAVADVRVGGALHDHSASAGSLGNEGQVEQPHRDSDVGPARARQSDTAIVGSSGADDAYAPPVAGAKAGAASAPQSDGEHGPEERVVKPDAAAGVASPPDATVLASGDAAAIAFERALDEWRALTAVAQAALARTSLDVGIAYAKERHQFGVPIGSFQTIQHRLADLHTRVDGARLLAYEAVWALDEDHPGAPGLAAQASWYCGQVADEATGFSLHVHGGYGFMVEYDVALHVRRAKATRLLLGDPAGELDLVAERRWGASAPDAAAITAAATARPTRAGMDFRFDPEAEAFRTEVRSFIDEHLTREIVERAYATGTMHDWGFHQALCERGYLASGWPVEVGGLGRSAIDQTLLMQELYAAEAPIDGLNIASMVGATLLVCGTDQQRSEVLPRILAGEVMCCLGYSEPEAGSDVAAVATKAVRDGDDWVIDGQKMFTTMAHEAHYVFLLTRTNPDAPKHKGLTMFLVPMDTPGIEVTPVATMGGERTNITFYDGVRVADTWRVGDVDAGWSVMHAALVYERNSANWGEPDHLVEAMARWSLDAGPDGRRPFDDPVLRASLARWSTELEVGRLLLFRSAWLSSLGEMPQVEGSMAKLHITEAFVGAASDLLDRLGTAGLVALGEADAALDGLVEHAFRHAVVTTIYGGSSEVQREIIAGRALGLPRNR